MGLVVVGWGRGGGGGEAGHKGKVVGGTDTVHGQRAQKTMHRFLQARTLTARVSKHAA